MVKKLLTISLFCLIVVPMSVYAQVTIKGKISDGTNGDLLPGANAILQEISLGASTNVDGLYEIKNVPAGSYTFVASFVGYKNYSTKIQVGTDDIELNVNLLPDFLALDEFVVTALGVKVNERAVTFVNQQVDAEKLNLTQDSNFKTALAGKVAGVQIMGQSGAKLGSAGAIRIRGAVSLTSTTSEPLYIVDGIPVGNPNTVDLNDVSDISVLKGPNATALYGQRGSNGAVLITTKNAGRDGVSIEYTNSVTWDNVAYLMNYQNEYGQGADGEDELAVFAWDATYPDYFQPLDGHRYIVNSLEDASWGKKFDGQPYSPWFTWFPGTDDYGKTVPYKAQPNNVRDFYETGVSIKNGVAVNLNKDTYTARVSYTNLQQNGLLPNSDLNRHYLSGRFGYDVTNRLHVNAFVNYTLSEINGEFRDSYANNSSGSFNQWFGRDVNMKKLKQYRNLKNPEGFMTSWNWWGPDYYAYSYTYGLGGDGKDFMRPAFWFNPYTWFDNYDQKSGSNTLLANVDFSYKITDQFQVTGRVLTNGANSSSSWHVPYAVQNSASVQYTPQTPFMNSFGTSSGYSSENNYELVLNYKDYFGDISVDALAGTNYRYNYSESLSSQMDPYNFQSGGLLVPDVYSFSNSAEQITPTFSKSKKKVISMYGKATVGFKDFIYVDASYRQDWSSALPSNNNGYGYPSLGASFVFTELIGQNDILSFGKFRAGWAQVGSDLNAYAINPTYPLSSNSYSNPISGGSIPLVYTSATIIDPEIKPALNSSFETGFDLRFMSDRIGFSATYYNETRTNEIVSISLSSANGASSFLTNAGESQRQGVELTFDITPIQTKDFAWNFTANWAKNVTYINKLPEGLDTYELGTAISFGFGALTHVKGKKWGQFRGNGFARDSKGNKIINANGLYAVEQNKYFGSILPDYTGGFLNTFRYKGVSLNASIDYQKGGKFFSLSEQWGGYSGLTAETAGKNDKGNPKRDAVADGGGVHVKGVDASGAPVDMYVAADRYYKQFYSGRLVEQYLHDASYIKLREVSLAYSLPTAWLQSAGNVVRSASIGLVARNLWMIAVSKDNKHNWDPSEMSNVMGENGGLPGTRSFGFNVKVNF